MLLSLVQRSLQFGYFLTFLHQILLKLFSLQDSQRRISCLSLNRFSLPTKSKYLSYNPNVLQCQKCEFNQPHYFGVFCTQFFGVSFRFLLHLIHFLIQGFRGFIYKQILTTYHNHTNATILPKNLSKVSSDVAIVQFAPPGQNFAWPLSRALFPGEQCLIGAACLFVQLHLSALSSSPIVAVSLISESIWPNSKLHTKHLLRIQDQLMVRTHSNHSFWKRLCKSSLSENKSSRKLQPKNFGNNFEPNKRINF